MKKIFILICTFCMLLGVSACKKKKEEPKEFNQGDIVIEDGIIYTYYTEEYLVDKVIPFVKEDDYKPYYNYYYYDMSNCDNLPAIPTSFEGALEYKYTFSDTFEFFPETFYDYLKYCEPNHSPTSAYFYRLRDFFSYTLKGDSFFNSDSKGDSFIVTGYTEDLQEDVVIPSIVQSVPVKQIGFKAFEQAPMKTLTFLSDDFSPSGYNLIHPFAISECNNLVELKTNAKALSMGVSNCQKLEKIQYIGFVSDCSLCNLPKLKTIVDCDARPYFDKRTMIAGQVSLHNTSGIRKSSIYNCPSLYSLTGYPLTEYKGVIYYDNLYPYYTRSSFELVLKDEFFTNLSWNSYVSLAYNLDTMELYLPFLNNGLNHSRSTIYFDSSCKEIIEKEDGYYISIAYPKIIKGSRYYSSLYEEPVYLKIISK